MPEPFVYRVSDAQTLVRAPMESRTDPGHLWVQTVMSAISPGTELAAFEGAPALRPGTPRFPRFVGYCHVGRVLDVGAGCQTYAPGDLVLSHAAHGSHAHLAEDAVLCGVPAQMDLAAASTTYLFHLGYNAVLKSEVKPGMRVAIVGLGCLGLTSAAVARMAGAEVVAFSNHTDPDMDLSAFGLSDVAAKTGDLGACDSHFDLVISTSNLWDDWTLALRLARSGGTVAVLGFPGRGQAGPTMNPLDSALFYDKQLTLKACGQSPNRDVPKHEIRFTLKRNCAFLLRAIQQHRLPATALIQGLLPADDLPQAYHRLRHERTGGRTFVLDWSAQPSA